MQRLLPRLCALIAWATFASAIAHINGDDEKPHSDRMVVIAYPVADLPIFPQAANDQPQTFRPTILIALIKAHCNERPWTGAAEIAFDPDTNSLVIRQRESIHKKIAELLEQFRVSATDDDLTQTDEFERQKAHALQAMFDAKQEQRGGVDGAVAILDEALASLATSPLKPDRKKLIRGALSAHRRLLLTTDAREKNFAWYQQQQRWPTPDEDLNRLDRYMQHLRQQPVDLPPDVEVLVDHIGKQTLSHDWPDWSETYPEEPNLLRGLRSR